jgi:hypothetical protein
MARSGRRTAVVERQCVAAHTRRCLPSKNEIWSATVAHPVQTVAEIETRTGSIGADMAKVRSRKQGRR